jgi:hypothetical protein
LREHSSCWKVAFSTEAAYAAPLILLAQTETTAVILLRRRICAGS